MLDSQALNTQAQIFPEVFGKREKWVCYKTKRTTTWWTALSCVDSNSRLTWFIMIDLSACARLSGPIVTSLARFNSWIPAARNENDISSLLPKCRSALKVEMYIRAKGKVRSKIWEGREKKRQKTSVLLLRSCISYLRYYQRKTPYKSPQSWYSNKTE